jgi:hypothetical protein
MTMPMATENFGDVRMLKLVSSPAWLTVYR